MLRTFGWIAAGIVVIALVAVAIGWFLPVGHVASRTAALSAPPARVYALVSDVATYPAWWSDIASVEMLPPDHGRTRFRQHTSDGAIVMEVVESTPPSRLVTRIADPDQPFGGTWTWEIVSDGTGSRVTITERGEIYHPVFRVMARFVFGYTGTMERCLMALEEVLRNEGRRTKN